MSTEPSLRIQKASRIAAVVSLFGFIVVGVTFAYSLHELVQLQRRRAALEQEMKESSLEIAKLADVSRQLEQQRKEALESLDRFRRAGIMLERAIRLQTDRKYAESISLLEDVIKIDQSNVVAIFRLARALKAVGRTTESTTIVDSALKLDPEYLPARAVKVRLLFEASSSDAESSLRALIEDRFINYERLRQLGEWQALYGDRRAREVLLSHEIRLKRIQQRLLLNNPLAGPVDGIIGAKTLEAVARLLPDPTKIEDLSTIEVEGHVFEPKMIAIPAAPPGSSASN